MEQAINKLRSLLPLLVGVKTEVVKVKDVMSTINYYTKFRDGIDAPSIIPIQQTQEFAKFIAKSKQTILKFKKSFNENDLPEELNRIFMKIFLIICKEDPSVTVEDNVVWLKKTPGMRKKSTEYVLKDWGDDYPYKLKMRYSFQAYEYVINYFDIIPLIEELESKM